MVQMSNIPISNWGVKKLFPPTEYLNKSVRNVIGERNAKNNKWEGKF